MTPTEALDITLNIGDLMMRVGDNDDDDTTLRAAYGAIRTLVYTRTDRGMIGETREGKVLGLIMDLADDHFDF